MFPCEALDHRLGNVREHGGDLMQVWQRASELRQWIRRTRCHCSYECAWTFNILGNWQFQPELALAAAAASFPSRNGAGRGRSARDASGNPGAA